MFLMFTLEEFKNNYSVESEMYYPKRHKCGIICRSEIEANECCEWLDSVGKRWCTGGSFLKDTCYGLSSGVICYYNNGMYLPHEDTEGEFAEDYMEWSVLKREIIQEPDLLYSESLDVMLGDVEVY